VIQTLADALQSRGYETLTPVQLAVTDAALDGADLLVSAQTGSGKTVGFGLAIAPTLLGDDGLFGPAAAPLALVIAPTRELALQVKRELAWLYAKAGATLASCVGGMDMRDERRALDRGAHIVVATPGRLRDHIQRNSIDLSDIRAVVLDEADEMLDLGFREDLEFILASAPDTRRTLMFSATVPKAIAALAQGYQKNAVRVQTTAEKSQHADIDYRALSVAAHDAENAIINVLRYHDAENAIVFANTRAMVNRLTTRFSNRGFQVVALSGELTQTERSHALQAMRDGRARVCVATDVAARGIDLPKLELVVHAELPSNADTLLHRSGRTGRAGRKGVSVLIVPPKARRKAEGLLRTARVSATWDLPPSADEVLARDEERLLADPMWSDPADAGEAGFVARLLERFSPEQIAVAFLRQHRARQSAPEDLSPPDMRADPRDAAPRAPASFGPGVWFSLSVGRAERAEARWILPMLCRAGDIGKEDIGAIRIQQAETFVEILATSVPRFLSAVGPGMTLDKGAVLRQLDGAPDLGAPARRDAPPPKRAPRPAARPAPGPASGLASGPARAAPERAPWVDDTPAPMPAAPKATAAAQPAPEAPIHDVPRKPRAAAAAPRPAPVAGPRWSPDDGAASDRAARPAAAKYGKPNFDRAGPDARGDKPRRDPAQGKPKRGDAPDRGERRGKPAADGARPEHGRGKPADAPAPRAKPVASDPSQRFNPTGDGPKTSAGKRRAAAEAMARKEGRAGAKAGPARAGFKPGGGKPPRGAGAPRPGGPRSGPGKRG
jgi:ATP-dependent RNA helicase DeaD